MIKTVNARQETHLCGPTHVSAVRSESVLAGKVYVCDVFVSIDIDGEDVSNLNSKEITIIMARKSESERYFTGS